jgi:tetratricopeptide (TPR) repeat protein
MEDMKTRRDRARTWSRGAARFAIVLVPLTAIVLLVAAAPPSTQSPDELVRRANEAFRAGDADAADVLYATAEELTADPGLVAFNRAAVLFERGQFRDAEAQYARVLDDAACPPERAARAWFNRGTCLLRRGGSASVYRSAIACFEHTIDSAAADEPLRAEARTNLELAKLLWNEARKKADEKKSPNDPPPEEEKPQPRPQEPDRGHTGDDPGGADPGGVGKKPVGTQPVPKTGIQPTPNDQKTAGNNANLDVLKDTSEVQHLSPEDTRAYLEEMAKRLKRERRAMLETLYGPDRPGLPDW